MDDPTVLLDPPVLMHFGCTLVEVRPDGEFFPIEVEDEQRPDGRMEVVPVYSPRRSMYFTALDVLAAAVLSRRVPEIVSATRYEPVGRQQIRRYLPVLPGLVLDSDVDPVLALVEYRRRAKDEGDLVLAALLRVVVNSLVFGNLCRFDEFRHKVDGRWVLDERPGPWLCLPIASCVAAGSRPLARRARPHGARPRWRHRLPRHRQRRHPGVSARRLARSSRWFERERAHPCPDRRDRGSLRCALPGAVVARLEGDPMSDLPPLYALVFGPKRHCRFRVVDGEVVIDDFTETQLGATYADPPAMQGRGPDGRRRWSKVAVGREAAYALARRLDPDALRPAAPWDEGQDRAFPALRRLMVKTPEMARMSPECLGARPGTRYLQATLPPRRRGIDETPVALDPGGDLADVADAQMGRPEDRLGREGHDRPTGHRGGPRPIPRRPGGPVVETPHRGAHRIGDGAPRARAPGRSGLGGHRRRRGRVGGSERTPPRP